MECAPLATSLPLLPSPFPFSSFSPLFPSSFCCSVASSPFSLFFAFFALSFSPFSSLSFFSSFSFFLPLPPPSYVVLPLHLGSSFSTVAPWYLLPGLRGPLSLHFLPSDPPLRQENH
jgi:hypothetical protein